MLDAKYFDEHKRLIEQTLRLDFDKEKCRFLYWIARIQGELTADNISPADREWFSERLAKLLKIKKETERPGFLGSSAKNL